MSSPSSAKLVRVSSWNVAAINDNPFEYYVTIDSSNKSDVNDDDISDENGNDDDVDALRRRRQRRNQKNYEKTMEKIDEKLIKAREHEVRVKDILSKEMLLDVKREIMNMKIDDSWTELECDSAMEFFEKHFAERKILSDFLLHEV